MHKTYDQRKLSDLMKVYPFITGYLEQNKLDIKEGEERTLEEYLSQIPEEEREERAMDQEKLMTDFNTYIDQMISFLGLNQDRVDSITIRAGKDKSGIPETFGELTIRKSEIVSIVGPTGSGKSRLLADIEWAASRDTPTDRVVLINGKKADKERRFSTSNKLVAQLSQNMNFVMDLSVKEFIELHAMSRMVEDVEDVINRIVKAANDLAGEKFDLDTPITGLSGGQSRALMIADTAILSKSPIVLIDEIENAGIDRKRALDLLISEEKIVLMATHDPSLALIADKRIIIKNGGIYKVVETKEEEKSILQELEKMDAIINQMRTSLRKGEILDIKNYRMKEVEKHA